MKVRIVAISKEDGFHKSQVGVDHKRFIGIVGEFKPSSSYGNGWYSGKMTSPSFQLPDFACDSYYFYKVRVTKVK